MTSYIYVCPGLIALGLLISFIWRVASRRHSIPCPSWLGWLLENPFAESGRAQTTISRLDLRPGMKVLDVGCGSGRLTIPIAQALGTQGEVVAIDIQPAMLRRARQRAEAANLKNVHFRRAGAGEGYLEKSRYDRALLVTVLGEIPDREAALKEIFGALKLGGMLSVTEVIFDPHFQSRGTILNLAGAIGFREGQFFGSRFAFTLNLEKPLGN